MNTKPTTIFSLIIFFGLIQFCSAQSLKEQFDELSAKEDTAAERILIEKWVKLSPDDPELYVAWFNYYVDLSHRETIRLDNNGENKDGFVIMSQDTSDKKPAGYLYGESYY